MTLNELILALEKKRDEFSTGDVPVWIAGDTGIDIDGKSFGYRDILRLDDYDTSPPSVTLRVSRNR